MAAAAGRRRGGLLGRALSHRLRRCATVRCDVGRAVGALFAEGDEARRHFGRNSLVVLPLLARVVHHRQRRDRRRLAVDAPRLMLLADVPPALADELNAAAHPRSPPPCSGCVLLRSSNRRHNPPPRHTRTHTTASAAAPTARPPSNSRLRAHRHRCFRGSTRRRAGCASSPPRSAAVAAPRPRPRRQAVVEAGGARRRQSAPREVARVRHPDAAVPEGVSGG